MNKFIKLLCADATTIKGNRAKLVAEDLEAAQDATAKLFNFSQKLL